MNLIKHCRIHCLSEAVSPITHMMGTSGNEAIINREAVLFDGAKALVPVLSGNALRHKMVREPGAIYLVKKLGLYGKLNIDQANYLFNGGSLTESSTTENLKRIAEMQNLFPLIRLLGGSLKNQVIGGSLHVLRGQLVCEENRSSIEKQLPESYSFPDSRLRSSQDFVDKYQYTRGDAEKNKDSAAMLDENDLDERGKSNLMIYSGQSVIQGSMFYHGFLLHNISPLEVGALLHSLQLWSEAGGVIGGSSRIGHGKLSTGVFFEGGHNFFGDELDAVGLVTDYIAHVEATKEGAAKWLEKSFPSKKGRLL